MNRLLHAAFARPAFTILVVLVAAGFGAVSLRLLQRDVFPDLSAPVFNVIVQNAAMGTEELEAAVAIPLETALAGLPDVRRIRSSSQLGVSQVTVEFEPETEYYRARQLVAERIGQVATQLPPGTDAPLLSSLTGRLNEILEFTLEADEGAATADLMALRDLAEFEVKNRLLAVPGVAAVERLGGYLRQFQIQLDPGRMSARGVTLDEILHAAEDANVNASGGFIVQGGTEWAVRAVGRVETIEQLRTTVVAVKERVPVLLGDVADVREAPAVRRGIAHRLRGEVVSCRVVKQFGADTVTVAAAVRAAIDDMRRSLPPGVQLRMVYDQSQLVETALGGVTRAILIGAALVVVVLFALLGNWRAALLVTLTLPLSIALAGLILRPAGIGINTMTLGGLAIAVGLLVDAAIIVTENVIHHLQRHRDRRRREVALDAAMEVGRPIVFATLIVVAVFVPLFAMTGIEGRMYRPLAAAVVAALAASLVLALTLVPVAAALLLRAPREGAEEDVWLIRGVKRLYAPLLDGAMRHAGVVQIAMLAITIPAVGLGFAVGSDFMPQLDEGAFLLQTVMPPDTSLEEVDRVNHRVEDVLRRFDDVEDVVRRTGRAERTEDPMPHVVSDVLVVLKSERSSDLQTLESEMREALESVPGASVLFTTPLGMRIDEGLGGTPADLSIRIFGQDLDRLAALGADAQRIMAGVAGITDLRVEALTGLPQLRVTIDREAVARTGLTPGDVVRALRVGLVGVVVSEVWVGQRRYDLVVQLADAARNSQAAIRNLRLQTHEGTSIPIEQVARVEEVFAPSTIRREAGTRRIAVEAGVSGRDLGGAAREVRERLAAGLAMPTGYFLDVGGRVEQQERAAASLRVAIAAAVLAVFLLLYLALGSFAETAVILATLPSALVGGILALLAAGETWNVSSLVGLIGLFGIAVQNGLVLVAQTRSLVAGGRPFREALREACIGRVRPKLLTAMTAILGLLPLLVLRMHGTEIERPLALVMIGGLVTSTLFTLLALPLFYLFVHDLGARWRRPADV
jgi:cobalt-zinc-cadmium resistance protein CzcA